MHVCTCLDCSFGVNTGQELVYVPITESSHTKMSEYWSPRPYHPPPPPPKHKKQVLWIRIRIILVGATRIRFGNPDAGGQKWPTKVKKLKFWSAGRSHLRDEIFSYSLDVLYGSKWISKLALINEIATFFNFFVIKSKPWIRIHIDQKCWIRVRIEINADPRRWTIAGKMPVLWIRIRMFLDFQDQIHHYLYGSGFRILSSSNKNYSKKNLDFNCFVTFLWLFIFEEWCEYTFKKF